MKIGYPTDPTLTRTAGVGATGAVTSLQRGGGTAQGNGHGVAVSLSSQAQALSSSSKDPDIDQAKVEKFRKAIEDGTFQVNPDKIADKLLANAQEMLDATRRTA